MKIQFTIELEVEGPNLAPPSITKLRNALADELDDALDYYLGNHTSDQEFYRLQDYGQTLKQIIIE